MNIFQFFWQLLLRFVTGLPVVENDGTTGYGHAESPQQTNTDMEFSSNDAPPRWFQLWLASQQAQHSHTTPETEPAPQEPKKYGRPTKHLGPLAEYSGDRAFLEPWIAQAEAKLMVDYVECNEITKFFMLHNRLRGEAAHQLQPWIQAVASSASATAGSLIDQLRLSFGDPHIKEKAQRKLHNLKQNNKPFMEYFTAYRKLVLEAGGTNWPDEIKKSYLEAGLNRELQQSMIGQGYKQSFEEYCQELKRVSDQLEAFNLRNGSSVRSFTQKARAIPQSAPLSIQNPQTDAMDWEPTNAVRVTTSSAQRAKWVEKSEIDARRSSGRCLRCGTNTHRVAQCPYKPAIPHKSIQIAPALVEEDEGTAKITTVSDEGNQGKE
jgi:hypothetical protein